MTNEDRKVKEALEYIRTYCKKHSCVSCGIQDYCDDYFHICPFYWSVIDKENESENNKR